jgi:hypothetical protein
MKVDSSVGEGNISPTGRKAIISVIAGGAGSHSNLFFYKKNSIIFFGYNHHNLFIL